MTRSLTALAAASITVLAACASSPREPGQARACALTAADSAHLARGPLFRECGVDTPAKAIANKLIYTPSLGAGTRPSPGVTCYAAEVEFVVGVDGRPEPETIRLVRTNDAALGQSLVASAAGWRYTPARVDGVLVRQIVSERRGIALQVAVVGSGGNSPARSALPPRCS